MSNRDYVLFLVDGSQPMHQPAMTETDEEPIAPIRQVLRAILEFYKQKALTGAKDEVALLFYGMVN
jgi:hypothetical protein